MKKYLNIIFINVLLGIIFFLILEIYLYVQLYDVPTTLISAPTMYDKYNELKSSGYLKKGIFQDEYKWRMPVGLQYKNPPIVVFGGSFAWGALLDYNQTFGYKLSELTKSPVYNFAISGWGIQQTLFLLQQDDFYNLIKDEKEPQYVVFVFISNHISRLYKYHFIRTSRREYDCNYLKYVKSGKKLKKEKDYKYFLPYSHLYFFIRQQISKMEEKNIEKCFDFMKLHFEECKKAMNKHWKNTKFVILVYEADSFDSHPEITSSERWKELENEGFIVIKTSQLTSIKLTNSQYENRPDEIHPNEKAWDLITPLLVKEINRLRTNLSIVYI